MCERKKINVFGRSILITLQSFKFSFSTSKMIPLIQLATTANTFTLHVFSFGKSTTFKPKSVQFQAQLNLSSNEHNARTKSIASSYTSGRCSCGRRHFVESIGTSLLPALLSSSVFASDCDNYSAAMLNRVHPPRPDWYEEFYASVMNSMMKSYEAEIAGYKSQLFSMLKGKAKDVLEIGIGTGPNLKYYAGDPGIHVFGVDPNRKMEKYARGAAETVGLSSANFEFRQAVGEALPFNDTSVDAVIGTLVLCSVKDVNGTLKEVKRVLKPGGLYLFVEHVAAKDGTFLRSVQNILNPLQKVVADGCHLTRDTGKYIGEAGFSGVDSSMATVSNASLINPHLYGIARK